MLDVQDPDIMNTLIDQAHVESILLIERRVEAANVIERVRPAKASKVRKATQVCCLLGFVEVDGVSHSEYTCNKCSCGQYIACGLLVNPVPNLHVMSVDYMSNRPLHVQ